MLTKTFLRVTDSSQVYVLLICCPRNDVFEKEGIRIAVARYISNFFKFVVKVLLFATNNAIKLVARGNL